MPVQKTFTLIPDARSLAAANNAAPIRPMTSKQIKKAHKKANQQPRLSRAEQRKLELAEQERIRKELEKDRQAARARAVRERKKDKELAAREAKKRNGKPIVEVRPSQDTISRFVRGNGTGRKRDDTGLQVDTGTPALPAVAEEPEPDNDTICDNAHVDASSQRIRTLEREAMAMNSTLDQVEQQVPMQNSAQQVSQRIRHSYRSPGSSQRQKGTGLSSQPQATQSKIGRIQSQSGSRASLQPHINQSDGPGLSRGRQLIETELDQPQLLDATAQKDPQEKPADELDRDNRDNRDNALNGEDLLTAGIDDEIFQTLSGGEGAASLQEPMLSSNGQPLARSSQVRRSLGKADSFRMDPDDLVDDDSLLQLDELFENRTPDISSAKDQDTPIELPRPLERETEGAQTTGKQESQSSLDVEMLEDMNAVFEELTSCICPAPASEMTTKKEMVILHSARPNFKPPLLPQPRGRRIMSRVASFADEDIDDDTLLCLDQPEPKLTPKASDSANLNARFTIPNDHRLPKQQRPTTYEKDLGLRPSPSSPRAPMPLSTQAIFSDLDDYFPSSSQQARELEDLPATTLVARPSLTNAAESKSLTANHDSETSPKEQKRFFSASGSNELLSLAIQRSRRSAALEEIQQKERHRIEAGLLAQQEAQIVQEWRHQQENNKRHKQADASTPKPPKILTNIRRPGIPTAPTPAQQSMSAPRQPPKPLRASKTFTMNVPITKTATTTERAEPPGVMSEADKENLVQKLPSGDNKMCIPLTASQETEYGGDWMDDAWTDFVA